ncbi:phosphatase PAP2 family protein [Amycolatopsis sp. cg5]|uniref:phosphatase PAP2 family protein n=1 Tax=Amycolatopsis sp. cg5 TaxID=3238802 RepID=UPI00352560C7
MNGSSFDGGWYRAVARFAEETPWLHRFFEIYTDWGLVLLALLALVACWRARGGTAEDKAAAVWVPLAAVLAFGVSSLVKPLVQESRPCQSLLGVVPLTPCEPVGDYSFPSNHAVIVAAVAVALFFVDRRLGWIATILALLLAFSRVYVGAHYPHDVFAGLFVGALVGFCGRFTLPWLTWAVKRTTRKAACTSGLALRYDNPLCRRRDGP